MAATNWLVPSIYGRFFRVYITQCNMDCRLRMELYGRRDSSNSKSSNIIFKLSVHSLTNIALNEETRKTIFLIFFTNQGSLFFFRPGHCYDDVYWRGLCFYVNVDYVKLFHHWCFPLMLAIQMNDGYTITDCIKNLRIISTLSLTSRILKQIADTSHQLRDSCFCHLINSRSFLKELDASQKC